MAIPRLAWLFMAGVCSELNARNLLTKAVWSGTFHPYGPPRMSGHCTQIHLSWDTLFSVFWDYTLHGASNSEGDSKVSSRNCLRNTWLNFRNSNSSSFPFRWECLVLPLQTYSVLSPLPNSVIPMDDLLNNTFPSSRRFSFWIQSLGVLFGGRQFTFSSRRLFALHSNYTVGMMLKFHE